MNDSGERALDFERRLESLGRGEPVGRERDGVEALALRVRESLAPPAPRAAFVADARQRLLRRLPRQAPSARARPAFGVARRLAFAFASILVALVLGTSSAAYAAQETIPGDTLYGLKRGLETARLSLTTEPYSHATLLSDLAAERMREVEGLLEAGREALLAPTLDEYQQTLDRLQVVVDTLPQEVRAQALAHATARVQQHQQVLERLLGQVPAQALPAIERAIERSSHSQAVLEALQRGERPSDLAPGQEKTKESHPKRTPGPPETRPKP